MKQQFPCFFGACSKKQKKSKDVYLFPTPKNYVMPKNVPTKNIPIGINSNNDYKTFKKGNDRWIDLYQDDQ